MIALFYFSAIIRFLYFLSAMSETTALARSLVNRILTSAVYEVAYKTPLERGIILSERLNNQVFFKREDLQPIFSFKIRGAYNKIAKLEPTLGKKGIITASAGNHAQGVALSAQKLAYPATIIMPIMTPQIKIDAVKRFGAQVILHGQSFSEAYEKAQKLIKENNLTYIPPFDDEEVIAGQGTIALEIISQLSKPIEAIFVPIGGGGLAAGIAAFIKNVRPDIKVIGVQSKDSAAMQQSIVRGEILSLPHVGLFADGTAVKEVGKLTFCLCQTLLDDIILVDTDAICAAVKEVFDDTRAIVEPSGALSLAGLKQYVKKNALAGKNLIAILSGANMNFHRLRHISERTELTEQKELLLSVTIPEVPGSFLSFMRLIKDRNITEFNYRYGEPEKAHIFVGIQTSGSEDRTQALEDLKKAGLAFIDLSNNEIAKIHLRHMVGGKTQSLSKERLFTFEFPEFPGALGNFLASLPKHWNITLFHYRNHGSDYGRVLIGIDEANDGQSQFLMFAQKIGYAYQEFTEDPAYEQFLKPFSNH